LSFEGDHKIKIEAKWTAEVTSDPNQFPMSSLLESDPVKPIRLAHIYVDGYRLGDVFFDGKRISLIDTRELPDPEPKEEVLFEEKDWKVVKVTESSSYTEIFVIHKSGVKIRIPTLSNGWMEHTNIHGRKSKIWSAHCSEE